MRLILDSAFKEEIKERQSYMYDVFHIYMIVLRKNEKYIELCSFPEKDIDYTFLIGHSGCVLEFLENNKIYTENLVLISCNSELIVNLSKKNKNKKTYIAKSKKEKVDLLSGEDYGFEYNLTESELDLYNYRNMEDKIDKAFVLIKEKKLNGKNNRKN